MKKKEKQKLAIKLLAKRKGVSLAVASHIYACWPNKQKRAAREEAVGNFLAVQTTERH